MLYSDNTAAPSVSTTLSKIKSYNITETGVYGFYINANFSSKRPVEVQVKIGNTIILAKANTSEYGLVQHCYGFVQISSVPATIDYYGRWADNSSTNILATKLFKF